MTTNSSAKQTRTESEATKSTESTVICESVSREYSRGKRGFRRGETPTVTALDNISLEIVRGEFVGIAGPSGSGKSTLLHLLAALDTPTTGQVRIGEIDTQELSTRQRARLRAKQVGIVFQRFYLLPSLSAQANVAVPLIDHGVDKSTRHDHAENLLNQLGLDDRLNHRPGTLSGGEQQRVAIARALITDPDVVIADEPTGELDTKTGAHVLDIFETAATDRAVILASHDQAALDRADRVITLRDGHRQDND